MKLTIKHTITLFKSLAASAGGATWTADPNLSGDGWYGLAGSADLSRLVIQRDTGGIDAGYNPALYVAPPAPTPPPAGTPTPTPAPSAAVSAPNTGLAERSPLSALAALGGSAAIAVGGVVMLRRTRHGSKT